MDNQQEQLQAVLDRLEEDLRLGRDDEADRWLSSANPDDLYPVTVLGALSITFWAKDRLAQRVAFLERAERSLRTRLGDERTEALLIHRR